MDKFSRCKSSREGGGMKEPRSMNDLRSYSTSDYNPNPPHNSNIDYSFKEVKISKSRNESSKSWNLGMDAELQRKKRVAGYKAYGVEGKMKTSFRKSFRWIKNTCNSAIHGIW